MLAPTATKKMPRSNPLKGAMSASIWWRNSLSASTTPPRKAPSAGSSPALSISRTMPMTMSSAEAVKSSWR